ncbi:hypothetical protein L1049_002245 [Liquidambar formosana]|uniref:Uncharacterized protein n=1 Tax=Liquidambar formosana TaxID=63359 RepID=A0AAP0NHE0_LIQFO
MASLGGKASTSSSSPCQTDGLDKSLCFWGFKFGVKKTEWYVFNLSSNDFSYKNEKKKRKLKEEERKRLQLHYGIEIVPARPIHHHHYGDNRIGMGTLRPISVTHGVDIDSCVIAVGSVVYRLGGHSGEKELHVVRCFDITCPENGWTEGPLMLCPRYKPRAVVLGGKDLCHGCARCSSQPTVVGDTVYWFEAYGTELYAYDFNLKKAFHCWIKGLNDEGEIKRSLHHLGGDVFCLVWVEIDDDDDEKPNLMRCHCLKFQVSKSFESSKIVGQDYQLNVSLKSCQSYHVDDRIEFLNSLLL